MSLTSTDATIQAMKVLGRLFPGETPSASELTDGQTKANQMLANWTNEQAQAIAVLLSEQNKQGSQFVAAQIEKTAPLVTSFVLAAGSYVVPVFTPATYTPVAVLQFADLTTPVTFPAGYDLAVVLGLSIELAPVYSVPVTDAMMKNLADAKAAANPVPNRIPVPGTGFQGAVAE
jgi:hypothetical protein